MEKQERAMNLKFGVIFAQKGQLTDDEFFSNQETSESFENFLNLLGEKITLKNWDRYRGGLDVHNNMTGTESVYTLFEDHQIMFHVSTLLPFSQEDTQQVRTCSFLPSKTNSFPVFAGFFGPIGKKCNFSSLLLAFSVPNYAKAGRKIPFSISHYIISFIREEVSVCYP